MAAGFSVVISATDKWSSPLAKFNSAIARTSAPVNALGKDLQKFGDVTGISALGRGMEGLGRHGMQAAAGIAAVAPALGAITGAASLAGMAALVNKFGELGSQLGFASQRLGIGASQLSALQGAARLAGGSAEDMTGGLRNLQQVLQDAVGGRNNDAVILFQKLGIGFRDSTGHARTMTDVLPEVADKLAAIRDPQLRALIGTQLLGGAYEGLAPLLAKGSQGLREGAAEARRLGAMTNEGADAARGFAAAQARVQLSIEGLGNSVATKLAPILTPMLNQLADWVATNSPAIAAFFDKVASAISAWVSTGGIQRTIDGLVSFGNTVNSIVGAIGGWTTAIEVLLALVVGKFAIGMVLGIGRVTTALGLMRGALPKPGEVAGALNPGSSKPGGGLPGMLGMGLGAMGLASSLSEGRTKEEQDGLRDAINESVFGKFIRTIQEGVGNEVDAQGNSKGLMSKWFGGGTGGGGGAGGGGSGGGPAPNGVPRVGPTFGPQNASPVTAAPGAAASAERNAESRIGQGPEQINSLLKDNGVNLDAAKNAWCAAFVNSNLKAVGVGGSGSQVATSFMNWGQHVDGGPQQGDVMIQHRGHKAGESGGHVGFASGQTRTGRNGEQQYELVSGNYGGKVARSWETASSLEVRRAAVTPPPAIPQPAGAAAGIKPVANENDANARVTVEVTHAGSPANANNRAGSAGRADTDNALIERSNMLYGLP